MHRRELGHHHTAYIAIITGHCKVGFTIRREIAERVTHHKVNECTEEHLELDHISCSITINGHCKDGNMLRFSHSKNGRKLISEYEGTQGTQCGKCNEHNAIFHGSGLFWSAWKQDHWSA